MDPPSWGPAPPDSAGLVTRCHELRDKPLIDDEEFWEKNPDLQWRVKGVIDDLETAIRDLAEPIQRFEAQIRRTYGMTSSE